MDEAYGLSEYLPAEFDNPHDQGYISFLWDSFTHNYNNGTHQFASIAFHMLTMSYVYFQMWQIKLARPGDFDNGLIGFSKNDEASCVKASSPFAFHDIRESSAVRFFKIVGCDKGTLGEFASLVSDRNKMAHANGNVFFASQRQLDQYIAKVLRIVAKVQKKTSPIVVDLYLDFLTESSIEEDEWVDDPIILLRDDLIKRNFLSRNDLQMCVDLDIEDLGALKDVGLVRQLHAALSEVYDGLD